MQFYAWELIWSHYVKGARQVGLTMPFKNQSEYYDWRLNDSAISKLHSQLVVLADMAWLADKLPYYNVHPFIVPKMAHIDLEKIPARLVETPCGFNAVNIRFSQQHEELTVREALPPHALKSIKKECDGELADGMLLGCGDYVHSMLMLKPTPQILEAARINETTACSALLLLWFGPHKYSSTFGGRPSQLTSVFNLGPDYTIADSLRDEARITQMTNCKSYCTVAANCMRIACTIGFMANSKSELIEPDVLSKDRFKFERGNHQQKDTIVGRAHRRGKIGWNVGNDLAFLGAVDNATEESAQYNNGKQLTYSHIRCGHLHPVRYGPNKSKVKIMWYRPVQVRADLPFK